MDLIKMGLRWDEVQPKRRADLFKCALLRQPAWRHFMTCSEEREEEERKREIAPPRFLAFAIMRMTLR